MAAASKVWLVGAGPGDPELLTVKAQRLLREADVVVYDRLVSQAILGLIPRGVQLIYAGKACGNHSMAQEDINRMLVRLAQSRSRRIVRLKGGDPYIFGRGSEEARALQRAGIPFEVVPGITAAQGAAASAGIPLTHRGMARRFQLITGHFQQNQPWSVQEAALADKQQTLVFYMALGQLESIRAALLRAGRAPDTPVALVEQATLPNQRVLQTTISEMVDAARRAEVEPPALVMVGETVRLARELGGRQQKMREEQARV